MFRFERREIWAARAPPRVALALACALARYQYSLSGV
jgi:hypothetical protein